MLRLFQNSTDEGDCKLPVLHLEAFDKNLLQVEVYASHRLILGDRQGSNEASETLKMVLDDKRCSLWNIGDLNKLFLVHNHALFEYQSCCNQGKTDNAGSLLDLLDGCVQLPDHLDINILQCDTLWPQSLGEDVMNEPPQMHIGSGCFLILHLLAINHLWCLLDHELLQHLDLLLEVASPCVVADLADAVLNILALDFDGGVFQDLIQPHFGAVLFGFPYHVSDGLLVFEKLGYLVLGDAVAGTLLLRLLLRLPRGHEFLGVDVDLWRTAWAHVGGARRASKLS